ncbi:MAG: DUF4412 domain-containing protein [Thermoanaerobaculia bacterium]|nr:DUF4412 domain-containing protein [Thermoanaerobaculia bacterium]
MKRILLTILATASLTAGSAFAQFEGQIDMKITAQGGVNGTGKVFVSKVGSRTEMDLESARMPMHMVTLVRFSTPDVMYLINDKSRTYSELDTKKAREQAAKMAGDKDKDAYSVKVLGSEKVLGYSTKHVLLSRPSDKSDMEVWTTKDLLGLSYESMKGLMRRGAADEGSMLKALRDAGAEGFFVKMVTREKGKTEPLTTMELTKAEKKSLPASMFEVPAGYAKQEGVMGAASVMAPPEVQEQMRKAMEGMTPEQRRQMEEMMKRQQPK